MKDWFELLIVRLNKDEEMVGLRSLKDGKKVDFSNRKPALIQASPLDHMLISFKISFWIVLLHVFF